MSPLYTDGTENHIELPMGNILESHPTRSIEIKVGV